MSANESRPAGATSKATRPEPSIASGAGMRLALCVQAVVTPRECPDCSATQVGDQLAHDAGCPLNAAANAVSDADAAWFDAHPGKETYHRALTFAEIQELRLSGVIPDGATRVTGRVTVTRIRPGLRMRGSHVEFVEPGDES